MSWNAVSANDVLFEMTPVEQATLNGIQGSTANLTAIIDNVVNAARGQISGGGNLLGPAGTIPDQVQ